MYVCIHTFTYQKQRWVINIEAACGKSVSVMEKNLGDEHTFNE